MPDDLLQRVRAELYHAKTLVRHTRNHTKTTAAALQDSETRIDALIAEIENPHAKEAQGDKQYDHESEAPKNGRHYHVVRS